jgi:hypothetical protein
MMHILAVITIAMSIGTSTPQSHNVCVSWYETQTSVVIAEDGSTITNPSAYYCGR